MPSTILATLVALTIILPFGAAPAAAAPPPGFDDQLVADISGGPMDVAWTPDGRMLIITKSGLVRVYQGGVLLSTPALNLAPLLCTNGERGLTGIAVHPDYATNHYVYLYYTYNRGSTLCTEGEADPANAPVNRLSRFVLSDANVIDPASEMPLFQTVPMHKDHHTGGDVQFGKDGLLYITVGDSGAQSLGWPQDLGILAGKLVRVADDGSIPAGNPYTGAGTARCNATGTVPSGSPAGTKCQEIFSYGFRNPFRMAHDPNAASVRYYINDVGQHTWEEISEGPVAGGNYGWQLREGPCPKDFDTGCGSVPGMVDPTHFYHHGPDGAAATGAAFVPDGVWPAEYSGKYLFADYVFGKVYRLDPSGSPACLSCSPPTSAFTQVEFGDFPDLVSMRFGPDGSLYYATRFGGEIRRITYNPGVNRAPTARISASPTAGPVPLFVQFTGTASSDPDGDPLTYAWDFESDGTVDSTEANPSHTYTSAGSVTASLTVDDGLGGTHTATVLLFPGNEAPIPTIETPVAGAQFAVGDPFTLQGSATDAEDGTLPSSALTWEVIRHHATHTHPFLEPTAGNGLPLVAPEPEDIDAAQDSYLEIRLTATDSTGTSQTVSRNFMPKEVVLTFATEPAGLTLSIGGTQFVGPSVVTSWEGYDVPLNAPDQSLAGQGWLFSSWSDGGSQSHTITTPAGPATYTATFTEAQGPQTFIAVADSYVEQNKPTRNYGSRNELRTDGSPLLNGYLRFSVEGISDFSSAALRVYVRSGASQGVQIRPVADSSWDESTITWNNAPAIGATAIESGPVAAGTWVEIDVSSLVTQNGLVSFAVTNAHATAVAIRSRESAEQPQLIIGSAPPPPPPTNQDPIASFTHSCTNLACTFDASGSSDADGTIVSYDWTFGGDGTGSGVTPSHTFSAEGTYTVQLTVTDNAGGTGSTSAPVTVSGPPPPIGTSYVVSRNGSTYEATSSSHTFTGTLKSVVENAAAQLKLANGGTIAFTAGDFDLGADWFELYDLVNITFEGAGMGMTILRNFASASTDTEPFDIVGADNVTIRDMTVRAGGPFRSTSDGLDFDNGNNVVIERVEVTESRGRGIILDGKGAGWSATNNVIRDCVITGIPSDGIELLGASQNLVEGCSISNVGGHGIQVTKSSSSAATPNKQSNDNIVRNNVVDRSGQNGIDVNSSDRNTITGNTVTNSGQLVSSRDGIRINSNNSITCDDNVVDGNTATDNQATKTQNYGLNIASSLCNRTVVGVNNFAGNLDGDIRDLGTDTQYPPPPADDEDPTSPTGLQATAVSGCRVNLAWNASTDNVGVAGYGVYRDGTLIDSVNASTLAYADTGVSPGGTYSYQVDAFDLAGNRSALSDPASASTPSAACAVTLVPVADSYVEASSPTANNGTKTQIRVDGSPVVTSYLKFDAGLGGTITRATLRIFANSNHSVGFDVRPVADSSWTENGITYANAPAAGAVVGSSGPLSSGTWYEVDVTSLVTGSGELSLALTTTSSTAMSLGSRESAAAAPQLVIEAQ